MSSRPPIEEGPSFFSRLATVIRILLGTYPPPESTTTTTSDSTDVTEGDAILRNREEFLSVQYQINLERPVWLEEIEFSDAEFFENHRWRLSRSFNLLLGRNGYGKSLLLRSAVALLKRDELRARSLLGSDPEGKARVRMQLLRRDSSEAEPETPQILRSPTRFETTEGEFPILAIPDARFTDRSAETINPPVIETDLARFGARHFLDQTPYQALVNELLYGISLDYSLSDQGFKLPVFSFLEGIMYRLTGDQFKFVSIERRRLGFEIRVLTPGLSRPLLIQQASQGTLSVLAMFGLIRSFLYQVAEKAHPGKEPDEDEIRNGAALVVIDEVDAHLHPLWQQKLRTLFTESFPNVQFLVSAHSPLVVAGCEAGEVAVLRRGKSGYLPELQERDFIGATSRELYDEIFDIADLDETYLRMSTEASLLGWTTKRIDALQTKANTTKRGISKSEAEELDKLLSDVSRMERAQMVTRARDQAEKDQARRIVDLEAQVARLQSKLDP